MKKQGLISFLLAICLLFGLTACGDAETTSGGDATPAAKSENIVITASAASSVETELYECADFSVTIPKGWIVTSGGMNIYHSIRVYDPDQPLRQMFVLLKADILLHSQSGKAAWEKNYSMGNAQAALFAKATVLENPSTEGFYQIFSQYTDFVTQVEPSYNNYTFPTFDVFTVTERFPSSSGLKDFALGDELLRASFSSGSNEGEGMFAATVVDFGSLPVSDGTVIGYQLQTVDGGYYMAYNIVAITAEKGAFVDWESVLGNCLKTLTYSGSFISATNQASNEAVAQAIQISQNFNQTMDGIMSSWESRSKSQDIMNQKQSDATLGYERVYDTETGEIYRATNGFSDFYDGKRYEPITDDNMYAEPIAGYIEQVG